MARLRAAMLVAGWTLALGFGLRAVDRWIAGPSPRSGWVEAARAAEVPPAAGTMPMLTYLPDRLAWPPRRVLYRADGTAGAGLWLELVERATGAPAAWIGVGAGASAGDGAPAALAGLAGCAEISGPAACPAGWRGLSRELPGGRRARLITRLDAIDARRVLQGLSSGGRSSGH
jgi:hypothetical protein